MKKLLIFGGLISILFLVSVIAYEKISFKDNKKDENNPNISLVELQNSMQKKKESIVYFYQTDCIYCKQASPIVIPIARKLNVDFKMLNLQVDTAGWDSFKINGTPTIIHFKNGKEINRIEGLQSEELYKEWLKKNDS